MLTQEEILNKVYNLILDPTLTSEERVILVRFKDRVGESSSFDREVMMLFESLRQLAVKQIRVETMSVEMAKFYKEISTYKEFDKQLGRGLISLGVIRHQ